MRNIMQYLIQILEQKFEKVVLVSFKLVQRIGQVRLFWEHKIRFFLTKEN